MPVRCHFVPHQGPWCFHEQETTLFGQHWLVPGTDLGSI